MNDQRSQCDLIEETVENDQQSQCDLIEKILENSKKIYVCPLCYVSYSEASTFFKHCREKGKGDKKEEGVATHEGLGAVNASGAFGNFLKSLGTAIGWKDISADKLPVKMDERGPREYSACFKIRFVVDMKTRLDPTNIKERYDILRRIAKCARIHYACSWCMSGFATSARFFEHCGQRNDEYHEGFLSKEQGHFVEIYGESLGQVLACDGLKINYDEYIRPNFGECFQIDEIIKRKRKSAAAALVIANTSP